MQRGRKTAVALGLAATTALTLTALLRPWDGGVAGSAVAAGSGDDGGPASAGSAASTTTTPPEAAGSPAGESQTTTSGQVQLDVTYHAQQDGDWCDPADIEMWLQADGIALPASDDYTLQQLFWDYESANNDGYTIAQWNASPYAVAATLDAYGGWTDVGDTPEPDAAAAGDVITESVAVRHQPVIVMVGGGTHYVLVTGVTLGSAGAEGPPAQVTFDDPLAYGVAGNPPTGSNGTRTMSWSGFTDWYTANTAHGGIWAGEWVLIAAGLPLVG